MRSCGVRSSAPEIGCRHCPGAGGGGIAASGASGGLSQDAAGAVRPPPVMDGLVGAVSAMRTYRRRVVSSRTRSKSRRRVAARPIRC
jgi:hypothetical protein